MVRVRVGLFMVKYSALPGILSSNNDFMNGGMDSTEHRSSVACEWLFCFLMEATAIFDP